MRCVVVDVDAKALLQTKALLLSSSAVTEVHTFNRMYEALLFCSKSVVDVLFLNMETPHVYQTVLSDKNFDPSIFLVLNAKNKSSFNASVRPAHRQVYFIYKPFVRNEILNLLMKFHKILSF